MSAERHYGEGVPGAELLIHVTEECLAARQAGRALGHGGAGAVKAAQRQNIDFAQQIGHGTGSELFSQLVIALPGGVSAAAMLESIGPLVVRRAVASVGKGAEIRALGVGTHG